MDPESVGYSNLAPKHSGVVSILFTFTVVFDQQQRLF